MIIPVMDKIVNVLVFDSDAVSKIIGINNENANMTPLRELIFFKIGNLHGIDIIHILR